MQTTDGKMSGKPTSMAARSGAELILGIGFTRVDRIVTQRQRPCYIEYSRYLGHISTEAIATWQAVDK